MIDVTQKLVDSVFGWLQTREKPSQPGVDIAVVRRCMLDAIAGCRDGAVADLAIRIVRARDPVSLWHQRSELLRVLSQYQGEARARAELARITALFEGLVPAPLYASTLGPRRVCAA